MIRFKKLHPDAQLPVYAHGKGDSGADLRSVEKTEIHPGERKLVQTGLAMEIPEGLEVQIRSRSGMALKHGVTVLNSPGTVDSSYTGPLGAILYNSGKQVFSIDVGDRIAQMVVAAVVHPDFSFVEELKVTDRGSGGFGSTGVS